MQKCLKAQDDASPRGRFARLVGVSPLHPDAVKWYQGALGELATGGRLATLGTGYTVLHSLPIGETDGDAEPASGVDSASRDSGRDSARDSFRLSESGMDVDHLVIGPAGVFCLSSSRAATAERIAEAQLEARRVSRHLSRALQRVVPVIPVLVNVGESAKKDASESAVEVVHLRALTRWFAKRGPVLTVAEIATIALAAEQPATWRSSPSAALSSVDANEFDQLKHQVEAASAREHSALVVTIIVGIGVLVAAGAELVAYLNPQLFGL